MKKKKFLNLMLMASCLTLSGGMALSSPLLFAGKGDVSSKAAISAPQVDGIYQISTADQLAEIASEIALNGVGANYNYELVADIDLTGKVWTPIGNNTHKFTGSFNGNGYRISNSLEISESVVGGYYGLFGYVENAEIFDIVLDNSYSFSPEGTVNEGTLIGYANNSLVADIYDNSTMDIPTIGVVAGNSKIYKGGFNVESGKTEEDSFTVGQGMTETVEQGKVVTFNAGAGKFVSKSDGSEISTVYKVLMKDGEVKNYLDGNERYGLVFPADSTSKVNVINPGYGLNGWKAGEVSVTTLTDEAIALNNYVVNADWKEIVYTLNIHEGGTGTSTFITIPNVKGGAPWREIIPQFSNHYKDRDLTRVYYGNGESEIDIYTATVTYDESGNKSINGHSMIGETDKSFWAGAIIGGENAVVSLGNEETINIYTVWQLQEINSRVQYSSENGAVEQITAESMVYTEGGEIELGTRVNDYKEFTVRAGTPFTYTLTIPAYHEAIITVKGRGITASDYSVSNAGSVYTLTVTNGLKSNDDKILVTLNRTIQKIEISTGDSSVSISKNTSYTSLSGNVLTTLVGEWFELKFIAIGGNYISGYKCSPGISGSCKAYKYTQDEDGFNDSLSLTFEDIKGFTGSDTITIQTAPKTFKLDFTYNVDGDYTSPYDKPEVTVIAGEQTRSWSESTSTTEVLPVGGGKLKITVAESEYYSVKSVAFNGTDLTSPDGIYEATGVIASPENSNTLTVTLEKRSYTATLSLKGEEVDNNFTDIKDVNGQTITEGLDSIATLTASSSSFTVGGTLTLSYNIVSEYYEFAGWYYSNGDVISVDNNYELTISSPGDLAIYGTIKGKTTTITISTGEVIVQNVNGGTGYEKRTYNFLDGLTIDDVSKTSFSYKYGEPASFGEIDYNDLSNKGYTLVGWGKALVNNQGNVLSTVAKPLTILELLGENLSGLIGGELKIYPYVTQKTATITYSASNKDGLLSGSLNLNADVNKTYYFGQEGGFTLPSGGEVFDSYPKGHNLSKWLITLNENDSEFEEGKSVNFDSQNLLDMYGEGFTIYPVWKPNSYIVTYYEYYNSDEDCNQVAQEEVAFGNYFTPSTNVPGMTVTNWKVYGTETILENGKEVQFDFDNSIKLVVNEFTPNSYSININLNAGDHDKEENLSTNINYGEDIIAKINEGNFDKTRFGYEFYGWVVSIDNRNYFVLDTKNKGEGAFGSEGSYSFNEEPLKGYIPVLDGQIFFNSKTFGSAFDFSGSIISVDGIWKRTLQDSGIEFVLGLEDSSVNPSSDGIVSLTRDEDGKLNYIVYKGNPSADSYGSINFINNSHIEDKKLTHFTINNKYYKDLYDGNNIPFYNTNCEFRWEYEVGTDNWLEYNPEPHSNYYLDFLDNQVNGELKFRLTISFSDSNSIFNEKDSLVVSSQIITIKFTGKDVIVEEKEKANGDFSVEILYEIARDYMDQAKPFFIANPEYDAEGVFADLTSDTTLSDILGKFESSVLVKETTFGFVTSIDNLFLPSENSFKYVGFDKNIDLRESYYQNGGGSDDIGNNMAFQIITYLGMKSLVALSITNEKLENSLQEFVATIGNKIRNDIDIPSFGEFLLGDNLKAHMEQEKQLFYAILKLLPEEENDSTNLTNKFVDLCKKIFNGIYEDFDWTGITVSRQESGELKIILDDGKQLPTYTNLTADQKEQIRKEALHQADLISVPKNLGSFILSFASNFRRDVMFSSDPNAELAKLLKDSLTEMLGADSPIIGDNISVDITSEMPVITGIDFSSVSEAEINEIIEKFYKWIGYKTMKVSAMDLDEIMKTDNQTKLSKLKSFEDYTVARFNSSINESKVKYPITYLISWVDYQEAVGGEYKQIYVHEGLKDWTVEKENGSWAGISRHYKGDYNITFRNVGEGNGDYNYHNEMLISKRENDVGPFFDYDGTPNEKGGFIKIYNFYQFAGTNQGDYAIENVTFAGKGQGQYNIEYVYASNYNSQGTHNILPRENHLIYGELKKEEGVWKVNYFYIDETGTKIPVDFEKTFSQEEGSNVSINVTTKPEKGEAKELIKLEEGSARNNLNKGFTVSGGLFFSYGIKDLDLYSQEGFFYGNDNYLDIEAVRLESPTDSEGNAAFLENISITNKFKNTYYKTNFEEITLGNEIILCDGLVEFKGKGYNGYKFISPVAVSDAKVGYYPETYWEVSITDSEVLNRVDPNSIYKIYSETATDEVPGEFKYYIKGKGTYAGIDVGGNKPPYNKIMVDFGGVYSFKNTESEREFTRTFEGIEGFDPASKATLTFKTTGGEAGDYSMLAGNLYVSKIKIDDGRGNVYTLVKDTIGFKLDETAIDNKFTTITKGSVDPNQFYVWANGTFTILADSTESMKENVIEVQGVKASDDLVSVQPSTEEISANINITSVKVLVNGETEEKIVSVNGDGAVFVQSDLGEQIFVGEIIGNGTNSATFKTVADESKLTILSYTYNVTDVQNGYYLGTLSGSENFIESSKSILNTLNEIPATEGLQINLNDQNRHIVVISKAAAVEVNGNYTIPGQEETTQSQIIYVNYNSPEYVDISGRVELLRPGYKISEFVAGAGETNIIVSDKTKIKVLNTIKKSQLNIMWEAKNINITEGTNEIVLTATEDENNHNNNITASDYITSVEGFAKEELDFTWIKNLGDSEENLGEVINLNKVNESGTYYIRVSAKKVYADYEVNITINPKEIDIINAEGLDGLIYGNDDKTDGDITFSFTDGISKNYGSTGAIEFKLYSDENCQNEIKEAKNQGTYYIKVILDENVYSYKQTSSYYKESVGAYVYSFTINKFNYELKESDISLSKVFGKADPNLEAVIDLNNEQITVTFTREAGEEVGNYELFIGNINSDNYQITVPENQWFVINPVPDAAILLELKSEFNMTYEKAEITAVVATFKDGSWFLEAKSGEIVKASVEIDLYYFDEGVKTPISLIDENSLTGISFSIVENAINVGSYNVTITGSTSAYTNPAQFIAGETPSTTTSFNITKREITLSNITKQFDDTTKFISNSYSTATLSGLIEGDDVYVIGTFASKGTASEITSGTIINISGVNLSGADAGNYYVSEMAQGKIVKNTYWKDGLTIPAKSYVYGELTSSNLNLDTLDLSVLVEDKELKEFISGVSFTFTNYSTGGYVVANSTGHQVVVTLSSDYIDFASKTYDFSFVVEKLSLTATISETNKVYDSTANLNKEATISVPTLSGDNVIVSVTYDNANVGINKTFILSVEGNDADNYEISCRQTGSISNRTYEINIDHTKFDFELDGEDVNGSAKVEFSYSNQTTAEAVFAQLKIPTRKGYTFEGWYSDEGLLNKITEDNILEFLNENVDKTEVTIYSNWTINTYEIEIKVGDENGSDADRGTFEVTGQLSNAGNVYTFNYFETATITVNAKNNYVFKEARLIDEENEYQILPSEGSNVLVENIAENYTLSLRFRDVNVVIKTNSEGELKSTTYSYGATEITTSKAKDVLRPNTDKVGYSIADWFYMKGEERVSVGERTIKECITDIISGGVVTDNQEFEFFAEWKANEYTIKLYNNTNESDETFITVTVTYGQPLSSAVDYETPVNPGLKLLRWTSNRDGSGTSLTPNNNYMIAGATDLYAQWAQDVYNLEINLDLPYEQADGNYFIEERNGDNWSKISPDGEGRFVLNSSKEYKITALPKKGYHATFESIEGEITLTAEGNIATISQIKSNTVVTVRIEASEYTITIKGDKAQISSVQVNGIDAEITQVNGNYEITLNAKTGDSIVVIGSADAGYSMAYERTTVDSGNATISNTGSSVKVTEFNEDIEITIYATPNTYLAKVVFEEEQIESVSALYGTGENVAGGINVTTDVELKLNVFTKFGYEGTSLSIADTDEEIFVNFSEGIYTISGFTKEFTIKVSANPIKYSITATPYSVDAEGNIQSPVNNSVSLSGVTGGKAEYNSDVTFKAEVGESGYTFIGWYVGTTVVENKITNYGTLVSEENSYIHTVKGETNLIGIFKYSKFSVNIKTESKGTFSYKVNDGEESGGVSGISMTFAYGDKIVITPTPSKGYLFDGWCNEDGSEISTGDGIEISDEGILTITLKKEINITAKFVAGTGSFEVENKLYINGVATESSGADFAKVSVGTFDGEAFTPNGDATQNKTVNFTTDVDVYIRVEVYTGYTFEGFTSLPTSGQTSVVADKVGEYKEADVTYYIYKVSRLNSSNDYAPLISKIKANENSITLRFINEDGRYVDGGRIDIENSFGVIVSGNYSSNVKVVAITGTTVTLTAYARLGFMIGSVTWEGAEVNNTFDPATGFTSSVKFTITDLTQSEIKIPVTTEVYNVQLYNGESTVGSIIEGVRAGSEFNLSETTLSIIKGLSRKGYALLGFYAYQNAGGRMYIDGQGNVILPWSENGYVWNGQEYVATSNYDPSTKTFKLYAGWERLKTAIKLSTTPIAIKDEAPTVSAQVVITSLNNTNSWLDINDVFYADILYGADITIKAPVYKDYKFHSWIITLDGVVQEPIRSETYFIKGGFNCKNVEIKATYKAKIALDKAVGGFVSLSQGKVVLGGGEEDYLFTDQPFTLTATAYNGYGFKGWYNKVTGDLLSEDSSFEYVPSESGLSPMWIQGRFVGDLVTFKIGEYDNTYGKVENVYYEGEAMPTEGFNAYVGDVVEIWISIHKDENRKFGVAWNYSNISYVRDEGDFKVYQYTISGNDVSENTVTVVPSFTERVIKVKFDIKLGSSSEYIKAGEVTSEGMKNNEVELSYGQPLVVGIKVNVNYKLKSIHLNGASVMEYFSNGKLTIPSGKFFTTIIGGGNFVVQIIFEEDLWIQSQDLPLNLPGMGTKDQPYLISTAEELAFIAYQINVNKSSEYANANYMLLNDVDLYGKFWSPIGTEENPFNGNFNFAGYKVFGITVEEKSAQIQTKYGGLFGVTGDKAVFVENNNAILAIAIAIPVAVVLIAVIVIILLVVKKNRKKKLEELANS